MKETIVVKINKTKSWFFERINKINLSQTHQEKTRKESKDKIINEKGEVNRQCRDTKDHKRVL